MKRAHALSAQKIKPLFDYVLVEPLEKEEVTPSGIVLPDTAKEKPQIGLVIAVGPGAFNDDGERIPIKDIRPDVKVLYKKWGGNEVKAGPKEYILLEQKDIMAIVQ